MKTPLSRQIGKNISRMYQERGWSQEDLAKFAEVEVSTVQRWISGEAVPCGMSMYKLSLAFGVSADAIYKGLPRNVVEVERLHPRKCAEHQKAA